MAAPFFELLRINGSSREAKDKQRLTAPTSTAASLTVFHTHTGVPKGLREKLAVLPPWLMLRRASDTAHSRSGRRGFAIPCVSSG